MVMFINMTIYVYIGMTIGLAMCLIMRIFWGLAGQDSARLAGRPRGKTQVGLAVGRMLSTPASRRRARLSALKWCRRLRRSQVRTIKTKRHTDPPKTLDRILFSAGPRRELHAAGKRVISARDCALPKAA
jgi:hypothetical protein